MRPYEHGMVKAAYVLGMSPESFGHVSELAGLALLAGIPARQLYKNLTQDAPVDKTDVGLDLAGLGILATPSIIKMVKGH